MPKIRKVVKPDTRFGRLVVVEFAGTNKYNRKLWRCICDCGKEVVVEGMNLKTGHTKSCGCYSREKTAECKTTHEGTYSHLYKLWIGIKTRCYNESADSYRNYGGRGISVYELWVDDYSAFAAYIRENLGERPTQNHSLDRVDNEGHYEPGNLRWATSVEQASNRRSSVLITHEGRTQTLKEWEDETGISRQTIQRRLANNWTVRAALSYNFVEYKDKD